MDGKVHVYRRENSRFWQCAVFLNGRNHRQSTKQDNLAAALDFARDWYLDREAEERLRKRGMLPTPVAAAVPSEQTVPALPRPSRAPREKTFKDAAVAFLREYSVITHGERNERYVQSKEWTIRLHLMPFFGEAPVSQIGAGMVQDYRLKRLSPPDPKLAPRVMVRGRMRLLPQKPWRKPSRATLHKEIVCLRQVLKTANRKGWITAIPDMSAPYKTSGKVVHRAWFSPEEYKRLYTATRERAKNPKRERWRAESEQLHDYVLFMVNTGLRPDEASRLEARDVSVVVDAGTRERILEIEVRGKRGVGYCKSMPGAVLPFLRTRKRKNLKPEELVFGKIQRELFNAILNELGLKTDRDGQARTAYSLRHTYISMRLMEGADIYQIAKNCRTSVEMIETYYASHIKNVIDAAAVNRRNPPRRLASAHDGTPR
jgi:integrase